MKQEHPIFLTHKPIQGKQPCLTQSGKAYTKLWGNKCERTGWNYEPELCPQKSLDSWVPGFRKAAGEFRILMDYSPKLFLKICVFGRLFGRSIGLTRFGSTYALGVSCSKAEHLPRQFLMAFRVGRSAFVRLTTCRFFRENDATILTRSFVGLCSRVSSLFLAAKTKLTDFRYYRISSCSHVRSLYIVL